MLARSSSTVNKKSAVASEIRHAMVYVNITRNPQGWIYDTQSAEVSNSGSSIKYVTLFLMIFDPPVTNCHKSWTPLKVCHTSEQKVSKQISGEWRLPLNNYNRYYILNNNKRPCILGVSNKPWNTLTRLISCNSEGDSCSLNLYYAW